MSDADQKKPATVDVRSSYESIKIYINGALHLRIVRQGLISVQSWRVGADGYYIQYSYAGGVDIDTEYDSSDKFLAVLAGLDKVLS